MHPLAPPFALRSLVQVALLSSILTALAHAGAADIFSLSHRAEPLGPAQAFPFSAHLIAPNIVAARWDVQKGHYLYQDKLGFEIRGAEVAILAVCWPPSKAKDDPFFGQLQVYQEPLEVRLVLDRAVAGELLLQASYQGCAADAGICYPPAQAEAMLSPTSFPAGVQHEGCIDPAEDK